MIRLKKVCLFLLLPFLILACSGSSNSPLSKWMHEGPQLKILSTTAQIGDLVSTIGGQRVDGWVLIQGDLDPHSYELVKGDGEKLDRADLIFYNGLGLEHGASLLDRLHNLPKAVNIGDKINKDHPGLILKKKERVDPHIWMDVSLWQKAIDPIVSELSRLDPEGASFYASQGEALFQRMEKAHGRLHALLQEIPSKQRYLVTSHDAFHYFTRSYLSDPGELNWTDRFAAPEGLAPDGQLNPMDIQKIIDFLRVHEITVLFPESNVSHDSIKKIARAGKELGLEIQICSEPLYGDSMSGLNYLEMMERNGDVIARHLKKVNE
ncbi:MAG: zinc ABC transporter substrate-binding protein [Chlamydiota bacterium]